jgi:hypothetical protein
VICTLTKHQQASAKAVEAARSLYREDNEFMRSVAAIIAMTAVDEYRKEMNRLKREGRA